MTIMEAVQLNVLILNVMCVYVPNWASLYVECYVYLFVMVLLKIEHWPYVLTITGFVYSILWKVLNKQSFISKHIHHSSQITLVK
jgi:hypothetical protein